MYNLCFCLDINFLPVLPHVFKTFITNNNPKEYTIHFITYKINDDSLITNILKSISPDFNIKIAKFDETIMGDLVKHLKKYYTDIISNDTSKHSIITFKNFANWSRFYISKLFPNIDYCLYLDMDILFGHSIKELVCNPPTDYLIGAIYDKTNCKISNKIYTKSIPSQLNLNTKEITKNTMYNCGVLYINLKRWREENINNRLIQIYQYLCENNISLFQSGTQVVQNIIAPSYKKYDYKYNTIIKKSKTMCKDSNIKKIKILPVEIINFSILHFKGVPEFWKQKEYIKISEKLCH